MKTLRTLAMIVLVAALLIAPTLVFAQQQGTAVYLVPNTSIATGAYVTGTASDSGTINKQLTVTITPPPGQFVYLVGYDWSMCQDTAAATAATNATFTTTGFTNLPKIGQVSLAVTNNICATPGFGTPGAVWPIKSQSPGTAVTLVSPSANTHAAYTLNAYAIIAP